MPAIATAREIAEELYGSDCQPVFLYVGSAGGVEKQLAEEAGIEFVGIATGKLRRSRNPIAMLSRANLADLLRIPVGFVQARRAVLRFKPHVVFSTGGYVSVPPVLAASSCGFPIVAHEQTVQIGLANRIVMRRASRIALSWPESADELPRAQRGRATVTGNPVRPALLAGDRRVAGERLGFSGDDEDVPAVYITGGAQGSRLINAAVADKLEDLLAVARIVHQCGKQPLPSDQDYDRLSGLAAKLPENLAQRYRLTQFVADEIGDVFALADLIIGRSGAGTVSEICAAGKAALLIPLVPTGGDEQTRNARKLASSGAAVILPQSELSGETLLAETKRLVGERELLARMGEAARSLAFPNAAKDLARMVIEAAKESGPR
jgi:UDP-N-acetylglucosamine--N-acetylmuramyl-(pentapeptide) pyrophosphoryl-undecaprenol N-acetylglucosamine transferase